MTAITKLFMSGRSQALRLPVKLRMKAKEVRIEKIGEALWVQPQISESTDLGSWLQKFYATHAPMPEDFMVDRKDSSPQKRDW